MEKKAKTAMLSKRRRKERAVGTQLASVRVVNEAALIADIRTLIHGVRERVASVANSVQTILYWHVGRRLLKENLQEGRGAYGKRILATVSQELGAEFGEGFSYSALTRMVATFSRFRPGAVVRHCYMSISKAAVRDSRLHAYLTSESHGCGGYGLIPSRFVR